MSNEKCLMCIWHPEVPHNCERTKQWMDKIKEGWDEAAKSTNNPFLKVLRENRKLKEKEVK